MSGLQSGVLTGASLTVVPVANYNPLNTTGLVVTSGSRDSVVLASELVLDGVGLAVLSVDSTNQHVVRDVVKVATVLQPWASHGDVIGGSLALALDEDRDAVGVLAIPGLESSEELQTVTGGGDSDVDGAAVGGRSLVGVTARVVALGGETLSSRRLEQEFIAVLVLQLVSEGVELECTSNSHGDNKVGRSDEGVGSRVGIVTASEVTVVGGDDRVRLALLDVPAIPLTDARTAGVGEDDTAKLLKSLQLAITLNSGANLLGTGGNSEEGLSLQTVVQSVTSDRGGTGHVLIRGVGARTDQTNLELLRPLVGLHSLLELRNGGSKIRSEGTVDVRLKLREVDLDQLVVLGALILTQLLGVFAGEVTNVLTLGGLQVVVHTVVEGEHRGGSTNLSTHVTDGTHTSARERGNTRSVVLNDSTGTTLDSEKARNLQDDILRSGPAGHLTGKLDTNHLGSLQLPGKTSHDIDSIGTTDTNSSHSKTTSVGGVRVGTDHQTTRESVVLQDNLVNDTGTGLPETNIVLGGGTSQEIINFLVDLVGTSKILVTSDLGLDQVVTVDGSRSSDRGHASRHELQNGHLSGGILASDTVGAELQVGLATLNLLSVRVVKVRVQNLLGVCERTLQATTDNVQVLRHLSEKLRNMLVTE